MTLPFLQRNAVVAASAGTGKTQLLTGIFLGFALGLAEDGKPVASERIVATTFSRAAAAEIRERLEARLRALANVESAPQDSLAALAAARGLGLANLAERARVAIDELPRATIDTLHGLAATILRDNAFELGLAPNFAILDEEQAFTQAERIIDDVLSEALSGPLADATSRLIDSCYGLERARNEMTVFLSRLDDEGALVSDLDAVDHVADAAEHLTTLRGICAEIAAAEPCPLTAPARAAQQAIEVRDFTSLRAALVGFAEVRASKSIKNLPFWNHLEEFQDGLGGGTKLARLVGVVDHAERAGRLNEEARGAHVVLAMIQSELQARRKRDGSLGFGDILRLARDALRDHPELALRTTRDIDVLLVDEFQDTSRVQRDLLLLLRERPSSIARRAPGALANARSMTARGLVVVGDRKQSIYGFRGADVSVFAELAVELSGPTAAAALDIRGLNSRGDPAEDKPMADFYTLTENYRSRPAILQAVNAIAQADFCASPARPFEVRYTDAEALRTPAAREPGSPGTVLLVEDDGEAPTDAHAPAVLRNAEGPLRCAFVAAGLCARFARSGRPLSEIALLARRRSTLPLLELALDRLGVPFVVAGRALYATPEVRDVFAALRLQVNPRDRHALAVVARGPLGGLSDRALAELSTPGRGLDLPNDWASTRLSDPEEHAPMRALRERLRELEQVAPRLSPRGALSMIADRFELEALYSLLPRGRTRFGNVQRLLEIAARRGSNLDAFVRFVQRQIDNESDEAEAAVFSDDDDAVRLLTIHGSKGLAFPTTILVDTGASEQAPRAPLSMLRGGRATTLVIRHMTEAGSLSTPALRRAGVDATARAKAERQRLSYVALTRARTELAIVLPAGKAHPDSLAASIARATPELCRIPGVSRVSARALLDEPALTLGVAGAVPAPPPSKPDRPRVTLATVGVTALSDFAICARRFQLSHRSSIPEPRFGSTAATEAADGVDDPRALGSAAHRVLEAFSSARWGADLDREEILSALAREGLDPEAPSSVETARGIARFLSGPYARSVVRDGSRVRRELAFNVPLRGAQSTAGARDSRVRTDSSVGEAARLDKARRRSLKIAPGQLELFALRPRERDPDPALHAATVMLKATLDLVVERSDGSIDVVDYKRSRGGDEARYSFQLAAYREAARLHYGTDRVRTGLVHLLAEDNEPDWQVGSSFDFFELGTRLVEARFHDAWPGIAEPACRAARCGFIRACHSRHARTVA